MRVRLEGVPHRYHEHHISAKGMNSLSHFNLAHKFIPMPQALKINPDAKAAVEKECEKLEKIPAWQLTKVWIKKDVIEEARTRGRKVHFASLMDVCHVKKSELAHQYQKYKVESCSEVTLWRMIQDQIPYLLNKDHQHHKRLQQKVMDIYFKTTGCAGQAADAVSAYKPK